MRLSILVALGIAMAACGGDGNGDSERDRERDHEADHSQAEMRAADEADGDNAGEGNVAVIGVVRVVGTDPSPQVVLSVGEGATRMQLAVVGDLREEIGRLSGVEISVEGDSASNPHGAPSPAIDVLRYDVVSVNSAPAYLGVLERREGDLWLKRERSFKLASVPGRLENLVGAKVWIVGPADGDELQVQSYGIVREY